MKMEFIALFYLLLVGFTLTQGAESQPEYSAKYPKDKKKVNFACENSFVSLSCNEEGERIRILLANYGRFSLVVCGQTGINKDWNVQCSAEDSMRIVTERCNGKKVCLFQASSATFGADPCPGTDKYVEVQYYCEKVETVTDAPFTVIIENATQPSTQRPRPTTTEGSTGYTEETSHGHGVYCEQTDRQGLLWPRTRSGQLRTQDCPTGHVGSASWRCSEEGHWIASPDLNGCVSDWMDDLEHIVETDMPSAEAMTQLISNVSGRAFGPGDLRAMTRHLLPGLISKMDNEMRNPRLTQQQRRDTIQNFNRDMVRSGSGLLESRQADSWKSLGAEERVKSATSLIMSLEHMARQVASTIHTDEIVTVTDNNIAMEVSVWGLSAPGPTTLELPLTQDGNNQQAHHHFTLPLDAISGFTDNDDVAVTYLFYNNLETLMLPRDEETDSGPHNSSRVINSNVVSASVTKHASHMADDSPNHMTYLKEPVSFTLSHKQELGDNIPVCAYWKYNQSTLIGEWSTDGCRAVDTTGGYTTCQCNHLTNFAVLMDVSGTKLHRYHTMALQAVTYVGCTVSIVCLLMCFISFSIFRNLQSDRNTIHKNLVLCLMIAELLFLFGIGKTDNQTSCALIAGFLHFFFLASFSWMCLEGIQLYFMLIEVFEAERSRVRWFYAFGYGVPTLIVSISTAADHTGYGTPLHCWLRTDNYFILSFVIPAGIVILINICMLSIAVYMMCRHAGVTASAIQARQKGTMEKMGKTSMYSDTSSVSSTVDLPTWLKGSAVLVVLLGLTWTFGFMYVGADTISVAYIFTILNSLQGLFIFIFHCFMDRKVKKEWRRAITRAKWLPVCCRVNIGGYHGNFSSPTPTSSSGPHNYLLKFWSSRRRKRSSASSATGRNRRSDLDSFLRSDTSSGCTTGTGVNRYSNQSDKLLPNGANVYTAMPTHYEGGIAGDLSVVDCSVVDSEYVTEYCQHAMQVSMEKPGFNSTSDDSGAESECDDNDNNSLDNLDKLSKHSLSFVDSNMKLNSEFTSDNEEGKINFAVLDDIDGKGQEVSDQDSERNMLNNLLSLYQGNTEEHVSDKNGLIQSPVSISTSQNKLSTTDACTQHKTLNATKSAPNLKAHSVSPTHCNKSVDMDTSTRPLLGSLPDLSVVVEENTDICSKSLNESNA